MKYLLMVLAVVMLCGGQALAANGNVSNDMLAKMGLSGMNVMSDAQGTSVRGMGFVSAELTIHLQSGDSYVNLNLKSVDWGRNAVASLPPVVLSFGGITAKTPPITVGKLPHGRW